MTTAAEFGSAIRNARKAQGESDLDAREAFWVDEAELLGAPPGESLEALPT